MCVQMQHCEASATHQYPVLYSMMPATVRKDSGKNAIWKASVPPLVPDSVLYDSTIGRIWQQPGNAFLVSVKVLSQRQLGGCGLG